MKFFLSLLVFLSLAVQSHADTYQTVKLAKAYYYGTKDVRKDYGQAKRYFLEAAQDHSLDAYRYLGVIYLFGHGGEVDYDRAKMWLNKAIASGDQRSKEIYDTYLGSQESHNSLNRITENDEPIVVKKTYYEDGALKSETPYKNGYKEGISKSYYENGVLSYEVLYRNGRKVGVAKGYYEDGKLLTTTPYLNGMKEGTSQGYDKNGNLLMETTYKNGEQVGKIKWYN